MIKLGDTVTAMSNLNYEITGRVVQIDNSRFSSLPSICVCNDRERERAFGVTCAITRNSMWRKLRIVNNV